MTNETLQVFYSCDACGLDRRAVVVRARGDQEIGLWMNDVTEVLSRDHSNMSPQCRATTMTKLYIPLGAEGSNIGAPVKDAKRPDLGKKQ